MKFAQREISSLQNLEEFKIWQKHVVFCQLLNSFKLCLKCFAMITNLVNDVI